MGASGAVRANISLDTCNFQAKDSKQHLVHELAISQQLVQDLSEQLDQAKVSETVPVVIIYW